MAYKLVELNNMAAYLDTDAEMIGNLTIAQIRVRKLQYCIFSSYFQTSDCFAKYIIELTPTKIESFICFLFRKNCPLIKDATNTF